ncbi:hypothetical protein M758_4G241700 [Ceratodon purpureus]|nr:hypothetical protein M758_4G241700 [Ceratodon purpureus]
MGMVARRGVSVLIKLWLPILVAVAHEAAPLRGEDGWNAIMDGLTEFDGPTFRDEVAEPLVQLSANAYRYPDVIHVPGWVPSPKVAPIAPGGGGMHALVYEEENGGESGRIVVAYRGTQIGTTIDCIADMCVDAAMWVLPDDCEINPPKCALFDNATLDYFSQAVEYALKVRSAYPSASLLFTGHSLGGGLAILISAALSTDPGYPVIAFGSAGTRTALQVRNLNLSAEHQKRIVTIADQWDEIMRTSWDEQLGWVCLYESKINFVCKKCFESPTCLSETISTRQGMLGGIFDGLYCKLCFLLTHYLAGLIHTIQKGARPACEFLA